MKKQRLYSAVEIMDFYEKEIDNMIIDEICETKEEAISLIGKVLSCGVEISEIGKVMFLVSKYNDVREKAKTKHKKMRPDCEVIHSLLKEYFPKRSGYDDFELLKYSEEYTYNNDDSYYLEDVKRRCLKREF